MVRIHDEDTKVLKNISQRMELNSQRMVINKVNARMASSPTFSVVAKNVFIGKPGPAARPRPRSPTGAPQTPPRISCPPPPAPAPHWWRLCRRLQGAYTRAVFSSISAVFGRGSHNKHPLLSFAKDVFAYESSQISHIKCSGIMHVSMVSSPHLQATPKCC